MNTRTSEIVKIKEGHNHPKPDAIKLRQQSNLNKYVDTFLQNDSISISTVHKAAIERIQEVYIFLFVNGQNKEFSPEQETSNSTSTAPNKKTLQNKRNYMRRKERVPFILISLLITSGFLSLVDGYCKES